MPAFETWLGALPATRGGKLESNSGTFSEPPASGDDFDKVMQATLTQPKRISSNHHAAPELENLPTDKLLPTSTTKVAAKGDKVEEKTRGKKKDATVPNEKAMPDLNATPVVAENPEPLPVFLSLPLFIAGPLSASTTAAPKLEIIGEGGKNSTPPSQTGSSLSPIMSMAGSPLQPPQNLVPLELTKKTETLDVQPDEGGRAPDISLKDFLPVAATTVAAAGNSASRLEPQKHSTEDLQVKPAAEPAPQPAPVVASQPISEAKMADQTHVLEPVVTINEADGGAGMGVASIASSMKNQPKMNKVAGPDVKVLPVAESGDASEHNLPPQMLVAPVRAVENSGGDSNLAFANGNSHAPALEGTTVFNTVDLPSLTDARMRAVERAHDMVALHSMRLVESKSDVLSVVIKPSVGTELSLELRQNSDGVAVQAKLVRGDHQFLNQHWPELQQRLEQRGIKLAPLDGEPDFFQGGNGQFQQQQSFQEDAAQQASAFAEFAATSQSGGATARLAIVHEGWESWA